MKIFHFVELTPAAVVKIKSYLTDKTQYQPSTTSCNNHNNKITKAIANNVKLFYDCHSIDDIELCLYFASKLIESGFTLIKHLHHDRLILSYDPQELSISLPDIKMMQQEEKSPLRQDITKLIAEKESLELEIIRRKKRIDDINTILDT